jgi:hypothetical protein
VNLISETLRRNLLFWVKAFTGTLFSSHCFTDGIQLYVAISIGNEYFLPDIFTPLFLDLRMAMLLQQLIPYGTISLFFRLRIKIHQFLIYNL